MFEQTRRRWLVALSAVLSVTGGCMCAPPSDPYHSLSGGDGLCGFNILVTDLGDVWTESGCENPIWIWKYRRTVDQARLAELEAAFAALPAPGTECAISEDPRGTSQRLTRHEASGDRTWQVCLDDQGNVLPPYVTAVNVLRLSAEE